MDCNTSRYGFCSHTAFALATAVTSLLLFLATASLAGDSLFTPHKKFPWLIFLPSVTAKHECSIEHIEFCNDKYSCESAGAFWWGKKCNENMSKNQAYLAKLAGYVTFHYVLIGITWTEHYYFDIDTLNEQPSEQGYFTITGTDAYGNKVQATEYVIGGAYFFINKGFPTLDERFQFWIDTSGNVSGNFRVRDKNTSWSDGARADLYGKHSLTSFPP